MTDIAVREPLTLPQQRLIEQHDPVVHQTVGRFRSYKALIGLDELVTYGRNGLMRAAHEFDPAREIPFIPSATNRIRWAIWDGIARDMPRQKAFAMAGRAANELADRNPIAESMDDTDEMYRERLDSVTEAVAAGVLAAYTAEKARSGEAEVVERLARERAVGALREAMSELSEEHQRVLILHYEQGRSLNEVATVLGNSPTMAKKLHRAAIEKLAKLLKARRTR